MANPHTITLKFPIDRIPAGFKRLTIIFTVESEGTNTEVDTPDINVHLLQLGDYSIDVDLDNLLMNPAQMEFEIYDPDRYLWEMFYSDTSDNIKKNALVRLEINRGSGYQLEFEGNIVEADVTYDEVQDLISFTATTFAGTLYDVKLYEYDTATNTYTWLDPLEILALGSIYITSLIQKIYQYLDPAITVEISQDWSFKGQEWTDTENPPDWQEYISPVVGFESLMIESSEFFGNSAYPTLGDVLKQLAFDFGCHTGMLSNKKAFFRKLYPAQPGSYITLSDDIVMSKERVQREYYQGVKLNIRRYYETVNTLEYYIGKKTNIKGADLEAKCFFWFRRYNPIDNIQRSDSNYMLYGGDFPSYYHLNMICLNELSYGSDITTWDKDITGTFPANEFDSPVFQVARYYYKHRCKPQFTNLVRFRVKGTDHTILTDFLHESQYFHVVSIEKNFHEDTTYFEAIRIN